MGSVVLAWFILVNSASGPRPQNPYLMKGPGAYKTERECLESAKLLAVGISDSMFICARGWTSKPFFDAAKDGKPPPKPPEIPGLEIELVE